MALTNAALGTSRQEAQRKSRPFMKRSPLNRKTPLKRVPLARGDSQLKRSRLKPMSDKKRQAIEESTPERDRYKAESVGCALHLYDSPGLIVPHEGIHELMGGTTRDEEFKRQLFWVTLCNQCHDVVQSDISHRETALAAKALCDWHSVAEFQRRHKKPQIEVAKVIDVLANWDTYLRWKG